MSVSEPGDVVLLAEMCERNGPVVVMTCPTGSPIPVDLPVRLFSSDVFGMQGNDGTDYTLQRDVFSIVRLTPQQPQHSQPAAQGSAGQAPLQPPQPQRDSSLYAACHHFQMCEMSGRGLVRKVCVVLLTSDSHKLFQNVNIISSQLAAVARCVCEGNIATFKADVSCIVDELRHFDQPPGLDKHCMDLDFVAMKEALPGLIEQYESLKVRPVMKPDPDAAPAPETRLFLMDRSIPQASPLERLRALQKLGRPVDKFRPLLSTLTPRRALVINDALLEAHAVCSLAPEVLWTITQEARFMSASDVAGDSFHTSICNAPVCSLSVFMKETATIATPALPPQSERAQLQFTVPEAVSALLRHHVLSQRAVHEEEEQAYASLSSASVPSKLPPLGFEAFGLKETRQYLTESLFKNIVFALLKGESVIIRGKPDERFAITAMVRALSVFIPQNILYCGTKLDRPAAPLFHEWREGLLDICDLGSVKLAGGPLSFDLMDRAKSFCSRIIIGDKSITAIIPKYRSDERAGLINAIVGRVGLADRWSNEVLMAHVRMEISNLGRNILHWIFQHGVARGRSMLAGKSRDAAESVALALGAQEEVIEMAKKIGSSKDAGISPGEPDARPDKTVRAKPAASSHQRPTLPLSQLSITADAPKADKLAELSEDDADLVQRLAIMMLRNELKSSSVFRYVNISHRQFVEEKIQRAKK